jgi:hypothetical protein
MMTQRMVFPKIVVLKELPQWIIVSDIAAYHPAGNTIYLKRGAGVRALFHELGHWLACVYNVQALHDWLDGTQNSRPK